MTLRHRADHPLTHTAPCTWFRVRCTLEFFPTTVITLKLLQAPRSVSFPRTGIHSRRFALSFVGQIISGRAIKASPLPTGNDDVTFGRKKIVRCLRHLQVSLFLKDQEVVLAASRMAESKGSSLVPPWRPHWRVEGALVVGGSLRDACQIQELGFLCVKQASVGMTVLQFLSWTDCVSGLRFSAGSACFFLWPSGLLRIAY